MSSAHSWSLPPDQPTLGEHEVHIWRASLDYPPDSIGRFRRLLSRDELARADRFHFDIDRNHFIVGRASLRIILGFYLSIDPVKLEFDYDSYGKPSLAKPFDTTGLKFNLAHSGRLALYGMTLCPHIGVDIEQIRPELDIEEVAERFFSSGEVARLRSLQAGLRRKAFFTCWTRKEAFIKAKGLGLSLALDQFEVTLGPEEPVLLLRTGWDQNEANRWSLKAIDVYPNYVAAIAVESRDWQLSCWQLDLNAITTPAR